jgi:hypothetical protein
MKMKTLDLSGKFYNFKDVRQGNSIKTLHAFSHQFSYLEVLNISSKTSNELTLG